LGQTLSKHFAVLVSSLCALHGETVSFRQAGLTPLMVHASSEVSIARAICSLSKECVRMKRRQMQNLKP
jgi:hypothetical protein